MSSRHVICSVTLVAFAVAVRTAVGIPPAISHLADDPQLTESNRQAMRVFSEYWCQRLADDDPKTAGEARAKLLDPFKAVQVSEVFRMEYTKAALPELQKAIEGGKPLAAVNALQVVARLGTPRALETIYENASIEDQASFSIRLWAAKAFLVAARDGTLPTNEINKALRQFGYAAGREPEWLVLRRQFEAIASVDSPVSREVQVSILRETTGRMAKVGDPPSPLMQATYPALKLLRDEYLRLPAVEQKPFGKELAPVLSEVCSVANSHWDSAQEDPGAKELYGLAVQISESMLLLIDPDQRPGQQTPRTQLGPAWRERNAPQFRADYGKWQAVLSRPPYR